MEAKRRLATQELSSRAEEETIRVRESGCTLLSLSLNTCHGCSAQAASGSLHQLGP